MARYFEKISFNRFKSDIKNDLVLYNDYSIPKRSTISSAGYDFFSLEDFILKAGESKKIATGIKVCMNNNEVLMLFIRSSMGFKYNIRLCNQVGILDSDYYNNDNNEGHIFIKIKNEGDSNYQVKFGEAICQGVFLNYLTVDNEKEIIKKRNGGFGSTNKGDEING
ncbi:MAG: deoxyuridine 5'-triphosphate nucleotidohydrolase [Bacilli bacterium]